MHIAILGLGTRGDLYPMLGMARTLVDRGHGAVVLEYDEYRGDVADAGLDFVAVGEGSQCADVFANVPAESGTSRAEWTTDRLYCEAALRSAAAFVRAVCALHPRPDALLTPGHHIGAELSAEALGIPLVPVFLGTSVLEAYDSRSPTGLSSRRAERSARLIDRLVLPQIARIRTELGLGSLPAGASFARADRLGGLILTAAPLVTPGLLDGMPPTFELAGYPDYYGPPGRGLDAGTRRFLTEDGPPSVVCSIGDGWARELPPQLRRLISCAEQGQYRLLVVAGRIPGLASGAATRVVPSLNLRDALAAAAVSVNHGGMGSIIAALRAEVPSVMTSQWPDGRRNAAVLAAQGLGTDLGPAPGEDDVHQAVVRILADRSVAGRLRTARESMRADREPVAALTERLDKLRSG